MEHTFDAGTYDVCVIGAGHAGCEAALAVSRLGLRTAIFTVSVESVALMPCNPNIGGSSKGHLVREIDALGGEMSHVIDETFLQSRMLGTSKGPAVQSLRAQADKAEYSRTMRRRLEAEPNLDIKQAQIAEILTDPVSQQGTVQARPFERMTDSVSQTDTSQVHLPEYLTDSVSQLRDVAGPSPASQPATAAKPEVTAIVTTTGAVYRCRAVIVCTGTYLNARCLTGESISMTGPNGLQAATFLSDTLSRLGVRLHRFKTGTPARMDGRTIDYSVMSRQDGDVPIVPFSFDTDASSIQRPQVPCYLTYTSAETASVIRANLDRSPLYAGVIEGTGPRYCPSIEDKVVRFPDRERHQVFMEPEGLYTDEVYVGGMSSSLPEEVQQQMYRTVSGLAHCRIVRPAYAIEYDCIDARQLMPTLELRGVTGLYFAGQINGSSGYEEAAAQGLVAGINAALKLQGRPPLVLDRSEAYIGVLIDDLVTKENFEPYRMMTARAEYRLLLRQDNADLRLRDRGHDIGLVDERRYAAFCRKREQIQAALAGDTDVQDPAALAEAAIETKYAGYIARQRKQVEHFHRMEHRRIPGDIDYARVPSISTEARQKLEAVRPVSLGQASRIAGVRASDISVLMVYLEGHGD